MKTSNVTGFVLFALIAASILLGNAGCRSFPNLKADHWVHQGNYGVATTHYEATSVKKQQDGNFHIGTYTGTVTILGGYGVSDTINGLTITPAATPVTPTQKK